MLLRGWELARKLSPGNRHLSSHVAWTLHTEWNPIRRDSGIYSVCTLKRRENSLERWIISVFILNISFPPNKLLVFLRFKRKGSVQIADPDLGHGCWKPPHSALCSHPPGGPSSEGQLAEGPALPSV